MTKLTVAFFILFFWIGCTYQLRQVRGDYERASERAAECLRSQVDHYDELCAHSTVTYEHMDGPDAHRAGVSCAITRAFQCMDAK